MRFGSVLFGVALSLHFATPLVAVGAPRVSPVKVPPLKLCMSLPGTLAGVITAKQRCSAGEQVIDVVALSQMMSGRQGPQGPAGPQGPQGVPGVQGPGGTLDATRCVPRMGTFVNADPLLDVIPAEAMCAPGEFLLTHGVQTSTSNVDVAEIVLLNRDNQSFPSGVRYMIGRNYVQTTFAFSAGATAVCCPL